MSCITFHLILSFSWHELASIPLDQLLLNYILWDVLPRAKKEIIWPKATNKGYNYISSLQYCIWQEAYLVLKPLSCADLAVAVSLSGQSLPPGLYLTAISLSSWNCLSEHGTIVYLPVFKSVFKHEWVGGQMSNIYCKLAQYIYFFILIRACL